MRDKGLSLVGVSGLNHLHDSLLPRDEEAEASLSKQKHLYDDEATSPLRRPWRLRGAARFSFDRTTVRKPVIE